MLKRILKRGISKAREFVYLSQVKRMSLMAEQRPLWLQVETINLCNARCVFCGYRKMRRPTQVLSLEVFEKVMREYSDMGGGPVRLTPMAGDIFLDPHLMKRFEILSKFRNFNQVSFTTNGIALKKYTDDELKIILRSSFLIQFSIGGLEKEEYKTLYGVDQLENVLSAVTRLLDIKESINDDVHVFLSFRTNNPDFRKKHHKELTAFKKRGAFLSDISCYTNYGGVIKGEEAKVPVIDGSAWAKKNACILPILGLAVASNGKVTSCGCVDMNVDCLVVGDVNCDSLRECWKSKGRQDIINSFSAGKIKALCRSCSAYQESPAFFAKHIFKNFYSYNDVPLEFYLEFIGG